MLYKAKDSEWKKKTREMRRNQSKNKAAAAVEILKVNSEANKSIFEIRNNKIKTKTT